MSADGSVTLIWAGEERKFRLAIGQLRELQESINKNRGAHPIGPWSLFQLVNKGDAWLDDLREIIRLGLIGGGTRIELVPGLIKRYVDERPMLESAPVAAAILGIALVGDQLDQIVKKNPSDEATTTILSNSPSSTDRAQQSGSPLDRLTNAPSGNSQHASMDTIERTAQTTNNPQ